MQGSSRSCCSVVDRCGRFKVCWLVPNVDAGRITSDHCTPSFYFRQSAMLHRAVVASKITAPSRRRTVCGTPNAETDHQAKHSYVVHARLLTWCIPSTNLQSGLVSQPMTLRGSLVLADDNSCMHSAIVAGIHDEVNSQPIQLWMLKLPLGESYESGSAKAVRGNGQHVRDLDFRGNDTPSQRNRNSSSY